MHDLHLIEHYENVKILVLVLVNIEYIVCLLQEQRRL